MFNNLKFAFTILSIVGAAGTLIIHACREYLIIVLINLLVVIVAEILKYAAGGANDDSLPALNIMVAVFFVLATLLNYWTHGFMELTFRNLQNYSASMNISKA